MESTLFHLQWVEPEEQKPRNTEAHGVFTEKNPPTEFQPLLFKGPLDLGFSKWLPEPPLSEAWGLAGCPSRWPCRQAPSTPW